MPQGTIGAHVRMRIQSGSRFWPVALLILLVSPEGAVGIQDPRVVLPGECLQCAIQLEPLVSVGDREGAGAIGGLATAVRLADGQLALVHHPVDTEIVVFSPDGRSARRVGRRGQGPGEFQSIRWLRREGDRLYVFDVRQKRVTVLSPDFEVVATSGSELVGIPLGDVSVASDSSFLMNALVLTPERVGFVLHLVGPDGRIITSLDEDPGGYQPGVPGESYWRDLTGLRDGAVWSAHRTEYRIDRWDLDRGTRRDVLVRRVPWFESHRGEDGGVPDPARPQKPRIIGIQEDEQGRLWILIRVASDAWRESLESVGPDAHPELGDYQISDVNLSYDTVVEVIDPATGALLHSTRVDEALISFVGQGEVVSVSTDRDLTPRVRVWRLVFSTSGGVR